jgi:hypothetical protein
MNHLETNNILAAKQFGSSVKGTWRGGTPSRVPERYLKKSLGRVSLCIGAPLLGNLEEGSSTGDSECRKGSRDGHLSL